MEEDSNSQPDADQLYLIKHIDPIQRNQQDILGDSVSGNGQQNEGIADLNSEQQRINGLNSDSQNQEPIAQQNEKNEGNKEEEKQEKEIEKSPQNNQNIVDNVVNKKEEVIVQRQYPYQKKEVNVMIKEQSKNQIQKLQKKQQPVIIKQQQINASCQQYREYIKKKMQEENLKKQKLKDNNKIEQKIISIQEIKQDQPEKIEKNQQSQQNLLSDRKREIEFDQEVYKHYELSLNSNKKVQEKPYYEYMLQKQPHQEKSLKQIGYTPQALKQQLKSVKDQIIGQVNTIVINQLKKENTFIRQKQEETVQQIRIISKMQLDERMNEYQNHNSKQMLNLKNMIFRLIELTQTTNKRLDLIEKKIETLIPNRQTNR